MGWWSLLPPLLAIVLAIVTRQVHLSLLMGIWVGASLLADGHALMGLGDAIERCVAVFADPGNAKVVLFTALVGATIALGRAGGGVDGFVVWVTGRGLVNSPRRARLLSFAIGVGVFVESSITVLVNGAVSRPIFERFRLSREKLAYLCDATSAPICLLIPLNAWGAYVSQLLTAEGMADPVEALLASVAYALYPMFAVALAAFVAFSGLELGPMRAAADRARAVSVDAEVDALSSTGGTTWPNARGRARDFVVPVVVMVVMMPIGLLVTGHGELTAGSGSTSVLWAVLAATFVAAAASWVSRQASVAEIVQTSFAGIGELVPLAVLMVLAFAIGQVCRDLETGRFVASLAHAAITPALVPAVLFWLGSAIAFSTGTSWGTFALIVPIAVPLAESVPGASVAMYVGAALSGGVFGDHCSPISDTTIISSTASGCDHIDHVVTQLPYALAAGAVATAGYVVLGVV